MSDQEKNRRALKQLVMLGWMLIALGPVLLGLQYILTMDVRTAVALVGRIETSCSVKSCTDGRCCWKTMKCTEMDAAIGAGKTVRSEPRAVLWFVDESGVNRGLYASLSKLGKDEVRPGESLTISYRGTDKPRLVAPFNRMAGKASLLMSVFLGAFTLILASVTRRSIDMRDDIAGLESKEGVPQAGDRPTDDHEYARRGAVERDRGWFGGT